MKTSIFLHKHRRQWEGTYDSPRHSKYEKLGQGNMGLPCPEASGLLWVPPGGPGILVSLHCQTVLEKFMLLTWTHRKVTWTSPQAQGFPRLDGLHSSPETREGLKTEHPDYSKSLSNTMKIPCRVAKDRHRSHMALTQLNIHPPDTHTALSVHSHLCGGLPRVPWIWATVLE